MTRVFDKPRYKLQTMRKIKTLISFASKTIPDCVKIKTSDIDSIREMAFESEVGILNYEYEKANNLAEAKEADELMAYAYNNLGGKSKGSDARTVIADTLCGILNNSKHVITDDKASYAIVGRILDNDLIFNEMSINKGCRVFADKVLLDIMAFSFIGSKMSTLSINNVLNKMVLFDQFDPYFKNITNSANYFERVTLKGRDKDAANMYNKYREGCTESNSESFVVKDSSLDHGSKVIKIHKFLEFTFIKIRNATFVLDSSSLEQVYLCLRFWDNTGIWAYNYRLSGDKESGRLNVQMKLCMKWIGSAIKDNYIKVTKHMKMCYARLINDYHIKAEDETLHTFERSKVLQDDLDEFHVFQHGGFYNLICSLNIPDRCKLDIAYMFHGLPAPDCDPLLMFESFTTKLDKSNTVNEETFKRFMKYTYTYDLVRIVTKFGKEVEPYVQMEPGYNCSEKSWFKRCLDGKMTMPTDDEFGKARIKGFFEFKNHMDYWYLEAADVTHVLSDISMYDNRRGNTNLKRYDYNELLYAMKHAPNLNRNKDPKDVRREVICGSKSFDVFSMVAAKSENTKSGDKVRETYSGSDCLRECTSELDRCGIPIANLGSASTMRVDAVEIGKRFKAIKSLTKVNKSKRRVIMSLDVSGWSPNANREKIFIHHNYVTSLSTTDDAYNLTNVWTELEAIIDKRGTFIRKKTPTGMFQGFTGTLDTALHQHIIFFAIKECKRSKILEHDECAYGLCLIDDGVIAVELNATRSKEESDKTCEAFMKTIIRIYDELGYKIDMVKTVCSDIKFTYLNRVFAEGNEILTPYKVTCKIDRELNRKFSTMREQISTVFGAGHSAVVKGEDPILAYMISVKRALTLLCMTCPAIADKKSEEIILLCFAPRSMSGCSFPTLLYWISSSITDELLHFAYNVTEFSNLCKSEESRSFYSNALNVLIYGETETGFTIGCAEMIRDIKYKDSSKTEGMVTSILKNKCRRYSESKIFKDILGMDVSNEYIDYVHGVLKTIIVDASILQELMKLTPVHVVSPIVNKVSKNELMNILLGDRYKRAVVRKIRDGDRTSVTRFLMIVSSSSHAAGDNMNDFKTPLEMVHDARELYYTKLELKITNHTVSDPSYILVHNKGPIDVYTVRVRRSTITRVECDKNVSTWNCVNNENMYANMYDGTTDAGTFVGYKTRNILISESIGKKSFNKVELMAVNSSISCNYISAKGNNGISAWTFIQSLWGCDACKIPVVNAKISAEVSSKRLGDSFTSSTNMIFAYPNVNDCMVIDSDRLGRYLDGKKVHADYMAIVGCCRISTLLEYACNSKVQSIMCFTIRLASVAETDEIIFLIRPGMDAKFVESINKLKTVAPAIAKQWMDEIKEKAINVNVNIEHYVDSISWVENKGGVVEQGQTVDTLMHVSRGAIIPNVNFSAKRIRAIAEERYVKPGVSYNDKFRRKSENISADCAFLSVFAEAIYDRSNGYIDSDIYAANKRDYYKYYSRVFGSQKVESLLGLRKNIDPHMHYSKLCAVTTGLNKEFRSIFTGGQDRNQKDEIEHIKAQHSVVMILYLFCFGKYHHTNIYNAVALTDSKAYKRTQDFAYKRQLVLYNRAVNKDRSDEGYVLNMNCGIYKLSRDCIGLYDDIKAIIKFFGYNVYGLHREYLVKSQTKSMNLPDYECCNINCLEVESRECIKKSVDHMLRDIFQYAGFKKMNLVYKVSNVLSQVIEDHYILINAKHSSRIKRYVDSDMLVARQDRTKTQDILTKDVDKLLGDLECEALECNIIDIAEVKISKEKRIEVIEYMHGVKLTTDNEHMWADELAKVTEEEVEEYDRRVWYDKSAFDERKYK